MEALPIHNHNIKVFDNGAKRRPRSRMKSLGNVKRGAVEPGDVVSISDSHLTLSHHSHWLARVTLLWFGSANQWAADRLSVACRKTLVLYAPGNMQFTVHCKETPPLIDFTIFLHNWYRTWDNWSETKMSVLKKKCKKKVIISKSKYPDAIVLFYKQSSESIALIYLKSSESLSHNYCIEVNVTFKCITIHNLHIRYKRR